jgi:Family of unknown function (DUF6228)
MADASKKLTITSSIAARYIELSSLENHAFSLELHHENFTASSKVWESYDGGFESLIQFFETLAHDWQGFDGTRTWEPAEPGFTIPEATHDGLAHIVVTFRLSSTGVDRWSVQADVPFDAGLLPQIASDLRRFLRS